MEFPIPISKIKSLSKLKLLIWNQLEVTWEVNKKTLNVSVLYLHHEYCFPCHHSLMQIIIPDLVKSSRACIRIRFDGTSLGHRVNQWKMNTFLGCLSICLAAVFWISWHSDPCIKLRVCLSFILLPKPKQFLPIWRLNYSSASCNRA